MVTASHNPKVDNGYKVYWANGSQIVPPHDAGIAEAISTALEPWQKYDFSDPAQTKVVEDPTAQLSAEYFKEMTASLCRHRDDNQNSSIRVVYTPMHGVGHAWTSRAFESFGQSHTNNVCPGFRDNLNLPTFVQWLMFAMLVPH
jgi:phosphomannomutase